MTTTHGIAIGLLITIGLLSIAGFIQLLMYPFVLASNVLLGVGDAKLRARESEMVFCKQMEARIAAEELRRQMKEVPDGRG